MCVYVCTIGVSFFSLCKSVKTLNFTIIRETHYNPRKMYTLDDDEERATSAVDILGETNAGKCALYYMIHCRSASYMCVRAVYDGIKGVSVHDISLTNCECAPLI